MVVFIEGFVAQRIRLCQQKVVFVVVKPCDIALCIGGEGCFLFVEVVKAVFVETVVAVRVGAAA